MNRLNDMEKKYIIDLIESGEQIPEDYKYMLFPNLQEEYELTYAGKMRKEDILAGEDGTFPVPLQIDRIFNGDEHPTFEDGDRKSTRLNSSHVSISYAVFCLKKKNKKARYATE